MVAQKVQNIMKQYQNDNTKTDQKVSNKGFHFKFADEPDAISMSGYQFNAITPFLMRGGGEKLPIILSEDIAQLEPPYLWHSGGRIQIKMGVSVADFKRHFGDRVIVAKI